MTTDPARPFGRVLTAMVTPFTEDGAIDLAGAAASWPRTWSTGRPRRPGRQRDDGRVAHDQRRREHAVLRGGHGRRRRPGHRDRRRRHQRHRALDRAGPRRPRRLGVARPAGRHAVLQQAAAGRAAPPLHGGRRRHRPAGHALRRPGRTGDADRRRDLRRLAEHPTIVAVKDAKGDFGAVAWRSPAPTWPTTAATTC